MLLERRTRELANQNTYSSTTVIKSSALLGLFALSISPYEYDAYYPQQGALKFEHHDSSASNSTVSLDRETVLDRQLARKMEQVFTQLALNQVELDSLSKRILNENAHRLYRR